METSAIAIKHCTHKPCLSTTLTRLLHGSLDGRRPISTLDERVDLTPDLRERLSSLSLSLSDSKSALHEIPPTRWFRFHFSDIAAWSVGSAGDDSRLASSSIFWCRFISSMILSSRATRFCLLRGVFVLPATHKIPLQHSVRNGLQWVALSSAET